jgi:very-short-patch-repair endonuclease
LVVLPYPSAFGSHLLPREKEEYRLAKAHILQSISSMADLPVNIRLTARRKQRAAPSHIERELWAVLRNRRFHGLKFRRQHSIGPYIADFYCEALQLVVEADGPVHDDPDQAAHDGRRDHWLRAQGLVVVRLPQDEITNAMPLALARIERAIEMCRKR